MSDGLRFFRENLRDPRSTGSVWPSGGPLARSLVEPAFRPRGGAPRTGLRLLEVGAGTGPATRELVRRLRPGDALDIVELNPAFRQGLQRIAAAASAGAAVRVYTGDILSFAAPSLYHHIVSGLPFANFPSTLVEAVYARFFDLLEAHGTLVMFQYVATRRIKRLLGPERRRHADAIVALEARLDPWVVRRTLVMANVPPARVIERRRPIGWGVGSPGGQGTHSR